jgi:hypothetical protein
MVRFNVAQFAYLTQHKNFDKDDYAIRNYSYGIQNIAHPFTGIHITEKGLDVLEEYLKDIMGEYRFL